MIPRVSFLLLLVMVGLLTEARPPKKDGEGRRREDWVVKGFRNETHAPLKQGDCQEGWYDSSSVGLGCILPDLTDHDIDEPSSETVCSQFGEGGRLVEIFNYDQMHFLRNMIAIIESDNHMEGDAYWWIGLTDHAEEGTWVWPSGMAANFTWWNEDYGEPYQTQRITNMTALKCFLQNGMLSSGCRTAVMTPGQLTQSANCPDDKLDELKNILEIEFQNF